MFSIISEMFCINNKFLLYNFVSRNLKLKYRKSVLGLFWTLLIPAVTALVYYFVFQYVMRVKIPNYLLFIMSAIIPWTFMQSSILGGLESIVGNHAILNKTSIKPLIFPLSDASTNLINLILSAPVVIFVAFAYGMPPNAYWLQLFPLLFALFIQAYSVGLLCGILFVYLRDLRPIMAVVVQIWFYLTPVIYMEDMIPPQFYWLRFANPTSLIFSGIHKATSFSQWLTPQEALVITTWTLLLLVTTTVVYFKNKHKIIERL